MFSQNFEFFYVAQKITHIVTVKTADITQCDIKWGKKHNNTNLMLKFLWIEIVDVQ